MNDALRPSPEVALSAWAARVRADREQVERCREVADPADFYAPVAERFRVDPHRPDDPTLNVLRTLARPEDTWLDIGAGGGRFALPIALLVREVVCVEPSRAMIETLTAGMSEHGIRNLRVIEDRWPPAEPSLPEPPVADVSLIAHLGYDIAEIGPFLDAMEHSARRLCVAVMGESAMTTAATLFWEPVHGEPRIALPALPELMTLLLACGVLPEVRLVERVPPMFDSFADLLATARRQLWLRPGSSKDDRLTVVLEAQAEERDGRWSFDRHTSAIGIVTWEPGRP